MSATQKLHALARISNLMSISKSKKVMNAFISSHFGYCPLTWMFHSQKLNNRINKIHEKSLRIVYKDTVSTFDELLKIDNSFKIHERNIQTLAIELYKVANNIAPEIMSDVFPLKQSVKYGSDNPFMTRNVRTVRYGTETLAHLGPKVWSMVPSEMKKATSLNSFKLQIKQWKPVKCPCKLCLRYISGLGYIDRPF